MKKTYFLAILAMMCSLTVAAATDDGAWTYSGGTGTADDPYKITTQNDMQNLYIRVNSGHIDYEGSYFAVQNDIEYSSYEGITIGTSVTPFKGTFDGQGYSIKTTNFTMSMNANATGFGVFAYIGDVGTVKNLTIDGFNITAAGILSKSGTLCVQNAGLIENCHAKNLHLDYSANTGTTDNSALVAYLTQTGIVRNCTVEGDVWTGGYFGGIVGQLNYGLVDNCESKLNIRLAKASTRVGGVTSTCRGKGSSANVLNSKFSGKISLIDATISNVYVGGIAANTDYSIISGCVNSGTIMAMNYSGGIVGYASNYSTVYGCRNEGVVNDIFMAHDSIPDSYGMNDFQGGIVGYGASLLAQACYNVGKVRSYRVAGGIVGGHVYGMVYDCYNAGLIDAPYVWTSGNEMEKCGGIVGSKEGSTSQTLHIKGCISVGTVYNSSKARYADSEYLGYCATPDAVLIENCYYDKEAIGWNGGSEVGPLTTAQLTSGEALPNLTDDTWTWTAGLYPRLKCMEDSDAAIAGAAPYSLSEGSTHYKVLGDVTLGKYDGLTWSLDGEPTTATIDGQTLKITRNANAETIALVSTYGTASRTAYLTVYPTTLPGSGTADDPYQITTYADLKAVASQTNSGIDFAGDYFKLMNDIDMESDASFPCFSNSSSYPFEGVFEGDGHSLKNWKLTNNTNAITYGGLFGYIGKNGVVKNIVVDSSCSVGLYRYSGVFVSDLAGRIENCRVLPTSISTAAAGGEFGGIAYMVESTGAIVDSYVGSNIALTGSSPRVGGIASNNYGLIEGCQYAGTLAGSASSTLGGISAQNSGTIADCLVSGGVTANSSVGGITANAVKGSISHCLVTATISFNYDIDKADAIAGSNSGTIEDCVYDSQITIYNPTVSSGITGKLTREIISGWTGDRWTTSGETYPQLTKFASESAALQTSFPLIFVDGDTRINMTKNAQATVYKADGLTWKLDDGDDFTFATGKYTLKFDGDSGFCNDTFYQTYNGVKRSIAISGLGNFLTGSGTEADPYIIATEANLRKLSTESIKPANKNDYAGMHFKITADIAMASTAFAPICSSTSATSTAAAKKFRGIIHGEGHTISGLTISYNKLNTGLVSYLGYGGRIENLTVEGSVVGTVSNIGGFAGYVNGGSIVNCVNKASVASTTSQVGNIGGIAGYVINAPEFTNLTNYGAVSSIGTVNGGVAGYLAGSYTYKNLVNYGAVTAGTNTGGVIGKSVYSTLDSLDNYGTVSVCTEKTNIIGGIVGALDICPSLSHARNYGAVSGYTAIGGIVGYYFPSTSSAATTVSDSYNAGTVTATLSNAGGIVGQSNAYPITIERCANVGSVSNTNTALTNKTAYGTGGILGYGNPTINDCYSSGVISALNTVGGILGRTSATNSAVTISNTLFTGTVEGYSTSYSYYGAIAGLHSTGANYSNVVYDSQMCPLLGAAKADRTGITAQTTSQIVTPAADAPSTVAPVAEATSSSAWSQTRWQYPMLTSLSAEDGIVASSVPMILPEGSTIDNVTGGFYLPDLEGATWTYSDPVKTKDGYFYIDPSALDATTGEISGDYPIVMTYGTYSRTFNLHLEYTADITTGLDNALTTSKVGVVAGGIVLPAGQYSVVALSGVVVASGNAVEGQVVTLPTGVYVVVTSTGNAKVAVR